MAKKDLIVDEDYIRSMQSYFVTKSYEMEAVIIQYLSILNSVKKNAVKSGEVAKALSDYIVFAKQLKNKLPDISKKLDTQLNNFINSIDNADKFLY